MPNTGNVNIYKLLFYSGSKCSFHLLKNDGETSYYSHATFPHPTHVQQAKSGQYYTVKQVIF